MMKRFSAFASALLLAGVALAGGRAEAASLSPAPASTITIAGNDNPNSNPSGWSALLDWVDGLGFDSTTFTQLAKIEEQNNWVDGGLTTTGQGAGSGTWSWTGSDPLSFLIYKGGSNFTAAYYDPAVSSATWDTTELGLLKGNGNPGPGISHIAAYTAEPIAPVPLPAAAWMLLAGLAGLIALRRRSA